jgi:hypothetical protein
MSTPLDELLFTIRQHPAFADLLAGVTCPDLKPYRPSGRPDEQYANHIYQSGARRQHDIWRQFLIGEPASLRDETVAKYGQYYKQQEKL